MYAIVGVVYIMFEVLLLGHCVTGMVSYLKIHKMLCDICHRIERDFPDSELLDRISNRKNVKMQEKILEAILIMSTLVPVLNVVFTYEYLQKQDYLYEAVKEEISKVYSEELEIRRLRRNKFLNTNNNEVPTNEKVEVANQYFNNSVALMPKEDFYQFPEESQNTTFLAEQNNAELGPRKVLRPRDFNKYN